jgi:hypothetical protein
MQSLLADFKNSINVRRKEGLERKGCKGRIAKEGLQRKDCKAKEGLQSKGRLGKKTLQRKDWKEDKCCVYLVECCVAAAVVCTLDCARRLCFDATNTTTVYAAPPPLPLDSRFYCVAGGAEADAGPCRHYYHRHFITITTYHHHHCITITTLSPSLQPRNDMLIKSNVYV